MAVIFWDTLYFYLDPTAPQGPSQPCHICQALNKQSHQSLRCYCHSWMMLSFYMLSASTICGSSFSTFLSAIHQTSACLSTLHEQLG